MPLGWQLGVLYALMVFITLSLVGSVVYTQQEQYLVQNTADRLVTQAAKVATLPQQPPPHNDQGHGGPGGPPDQSQYPGGQDDSRTHLIENLVRGLSGPDITVAVLDTQGNVITSTQALNGGSQPVVEPVTAQQVAEVLSSNKPVQWTVQRPGGSRQVVVLTAVTPQQSGISAGQTQPTTLLVEQSASLAAADDALTSLALILVLGVIGGTVVGVALVLLLTRAVLRPLDRVADTADAIASGDLHRRLDLPEGRSEVARLGKAFDYMVGRLVASLETQRRFVADASHELRTPLTSLKGLAEILVIGAHGNDTRVIEQSARAINGELDRLIRLVTDLLTLSRLDNTTASPTPRVRRARMDVCATVSAAVTQMSGSAEARGVGLSQECPGPLSITGDAGQIKQVLLNLIDNALRHTPKGGEVSVKATGGAGSVSIEVKDTGSGIDPKDLPHIFERFYRGDVSRTRATGNSGLGLAIVKTIVEAHGGAIEVESTPGQGTRFTIQLPIEPKVDVEQPPREAADHLTAHNNPGIVRD
jgi:two-component system OmpR family sensor kinase